MAKRISFASYDPTLPGLTQKSNAAYINIVTSLNGTAIKPETPSDWKRMVRLLDALDKLKHEETVEEGGQKHQVSRLVETGGTIVLEDAEFELLKKIWDAYVSSLTLTSARGVIVTQSIFDAAEDVEPGA